MALASSDKMAAPMEKHFLPNQAIRTNIVTLIRMEIFILKPYEQKKSRKIFDKFSKCARIAQIIDKKQLSNDWATLSGIERYFRLNRIYDCSEECNENFLKNVYCIYLLEMR